MTLDQVEPVDYFVPGCPPESPRVWEVLELFAAAFLGKAALPASRLGARGNRARRCAKNVPARDSRGR